MMKISIAALCSLLLCLYLATAQARTDMDGFQGMRWGSSLGDLQRTKKLILTKENDGSGGSLYALQNESLRFGKATLTGIHCSFVQERLQGVILLFAGAGNYGAVKTEATTRYGQPIKVDQDGGEMFTWPGETTSIVLSYTNNAQSGFLFLKPKNEKKIPPAAGGKKPAPSIVQPTPPPPPVPSGPDELDLFDQASVPQNITIQPSSPETSGSVAPEKLAGHGDNAHPVPASPQESTSIDLISEEVQGLIDRDQALTRLCWDTVGPTADQACEEMKANVQQLQRLGWCMKPGEAQDGLQVVWFRCNDGQMPATSQPPSFAEPGSPPTITPDQNPKTGPCRLAGELFAAAADMRERGVTPLAAEEALLQRQSGRTTQLGIEHIRETVELVYFDQEFRTMPANQLAFRVEEQCMAGQGPYIQPLPQE
jgi:hypothetical protein